MLWLTGLMGMMVLGSFAAVVLPVPEVEEDEAETDMAEDGGQALAQDPDIPFALPSIFSHDGPINADPVRPADPALSLLSGGEGVDFLQGGNGQDMLLGQSGGDELRGGDGDDSLWGGDGDDTLHGEAEDDALWGDTGDDSLLGHDGDDGLDGGDGQDTLWGGLGDDTLTGGSGDDALHGREGADVMDGGAGADTLFGGDGDDLLLGRLLGDQGGDVDFLNGGDGADTLVAGAGDILTGGDGTDEFVVGEWGDDPDDDTPAQFTDFDPDEDRMVVVYDDSTDAEPEVDLRPNAEDPALVDLVVNGAVLSTLAQADAPSLDSIVLLGQSSAAAMLGES
ncbi:calcium-binding protein [Mesobacterium sp. TK19101]|uniref:Calcium-binding protein n=1 Tax=Mesobacterium hydrothermale TaxID=3111907 RepID=A0ABU6HQ32_9RHOB|nr:calcium-binding protein [Mesobacterium sp. TK19101]MEC3863345.1 calcium-binding protein [Mesobacterium sp. TK19101]